jgi:hypothetical protein
MCVPHFQWGLRSPGHDSQSQACLQFSAEIHSIPWYGLATCVSLDSLWLAHDSKKTAATTRCPRYQGHVSDQRAGDGCLCSCLSSPPNAVNLFLIADELELVFLAAELECRRDGWGQFSQRSR